MRMGTARPIRIALVDDYDVVLAGVVNMLEPYRGRVEVAEIDANEPLLADVDIALYDSFAQPIAGDGRLATLVSGDHSPRVAVYTWNFHPELIDAALAEGAVGYLSKTLPAGDLVAALERIQTGQLVISPSPVRARMNLAQDWPGRREGLTGRQAEILALITQGKSNAEIAGSMFLSPNTIKSYIRDLYRKIGAVSRTQAVLWGVQHGFRPDHDRFTLWRGLGRADLDECRTE